MRTKDIVALIHDMQGHAQKVRRTQLRISAQNSWSTLRNLHTLSRPSEHRINPNVLDLAWELSDISPNLYLHACILLALDVLIYCGRWAVVRDQSQNGTHATRDPRDWRVTCNLRQTSNSIVRLVSRPVMANWESKMRMSHESWQTRSPRQEACCAHLEVIHVFRVAIYSTPKWVSLTHDTFIQRCGVVRMVVRGDDFVIGGD